MKNNYSIKERNRIVEEHLWCIKTVMKQNGALIRAAHLDRDDVFQQLSVRLIRAVDRYDPDKSELTKHIFCQLHYELLNCANAYRTTGITGAPKGFRRSEVASLNAFAPEAILAEEYLAA